MLLTVSDTDTSPLNKSMPVGPVAGGIMGCLLLLALGVYCYRCYARRRSHHCNGSLPGEAQLRDSNIEFEDLDDANNGTLIILSSLFITPEDSIKIKIHIKILHN